MARGGFCTTSCSLRSSKKILQAFQTILQNGAPGKVSRQLGRHTESRNQLLYQRKYADGHKKAKESGGGYYASVAYLDAQVGKVMEALEKSGKRDETIVIFTSDHGFHLGEHDFWAKVSLRDESAKVPLIISIPGKKPAVCNSFVELLDLYPTLSSLCGLPEQSRLQGKDISKMFDDHKHQIRKEAFSVAPMRTGFLLRNEKMGLHSIR